MKQPNGPDGTYGKERRLARHYTSLAELLRAWEIHRVARQLHHSVSIEDARSAAQRRLPAHRAAMPCTP